MELYPFLQRQTKVTAGIVGIMLIIFVYMKTDIHQLLTTKKVHYDSLVNAVAARASQDGYIIVAMVDEAYSDMAINLYEASLRPHHIDNYLFVGIGKSTCDILHRQSLPCFYYRDDPNAGQPSLFRSADFNRKVNTRADIILEVLSANFTVISTDVDVYFFGNPMKEIKVNYFCLSNAMYSIGQNIKLL